MDTRDHEDHTFCGDNTTRTTCLKVCALFYKPVCAGVMFDVECKETKGVPKDYIEISEVPVAILGSSTPVLHGPVPMSCASGVGAGVPWPD